MNALKYPIFITIFIIVAAFLTFNSSSEPPEAIKASVIPTTNLPTRWEMYNALREHGKMLLVHNAKDEESLKAYEDLAKSMSNQRRWQLNTELKHANEISDEEIKSNPIFLVGSFQNNQWISKLATTLPVTLKNEAFSFNGMDYAKQDDLFKLSFYPHPYHSQFPIFMITGIDDQSVTKAISHQSSQRYRNIFRSNWNYEIIREGKSIIFGQFDEKTGLIDPEIHFDFSDLQVNTFESDHFSLISYSKEIGQKKLNELSLRSENAFQKILAFTGIKEEEVHLKYFIYSSTEEKGLRAHNMDEAHINHEDKSVHIILDDNFRGDLWQMENELILRQLLGSSKLMSLEKGLGVYFSEQWQKKGYAYWANRLYHSNNMPPLKDLLDNELLQKESDLVMTCTAGSFVAFLIDEWGKDKFLEKYAQWIPEENEVKKLEKAWHRFLKKQDKSIAIGRKKSFPFLKGFNFAHEGYSIYNGYGSRLASRSLQKLSDINSNAVAIVPYSGMRDPKKPSYIGISSRAGSENDESVLHSHFEAQKRGFTTVLKPQIWIGRGSWPGDVEMSSEIEWKQFFEYYHRWMRHYALLAEMYDFDVLCAGVEFAKATIAREQDWRNLIQKLRGIYSGPITYAANWGEEFENLKFWDELDYIGIDCYYPLSKNEQPAKEELDTHFKKVMNLIEKTCKKYDRPMLFTEIGFRSVEETWTQPHEEARGRSFSELCQNICYEVVLENLKNKDFCKGILWWKWSCNLDNRERENTGFTPYNKMAQQTVKKMFKEM